MNGWDDGRTDNNRENAWDDQNPRKMKSKP